MDPLSSGSASPTNFTEIEATIEPEPSGHLIKGNSMLVSTSKLVASSCKFTAAIPNPRYEKPPNKVGFGCLTTTQSGCK